MTDIHAAFLALGFCLCVILLCAIFRDLGYKRGQSDGFDSGYFRGKQDADDWWIGAESEIDQARQKLWEKRTK